MSDTYFPEGEEPRHSGGPTTTTLDEPLRDPRGDEHSPWRLPPAAGAGGGGWGQWGQTTWAPPPQRPSRPHPLRALAVGALVLATVAASAATGFELARAHNATNTAAGGSSGAAGPSNGTAAKVDPGLVDVNTQLGYQSAAAAGTGLVLTSSGEVLTNNHVIEGATSISVTDIGNGRTYSARVVGTDSTHDVAVLQLDGASGLATVKIGNSSSLAVGQNVVAIGNAGGAGGTPSVSSGKVTALNQQISASDELSSSSEQLYGLIETDASLQPGDSGGSLVNPAGEVVGMDTAASSGFQFDAASNQSYAIPIDTALSIAKQIEAGRASATVHIGRAAFLGVEITSPDSYFNSQASGAQVVQVVPGSPADNAGLVAGDVIDSLDSHSVDSPNAVSAIMEGLHPGDTVEVGWVDSSGNQQNTEIQLAAGPPA